MSTTLAPARRPFRERWTDFWFSAADPTMLGFMRIVAGLSIVYLHASYTLDLNRFFGPYAWYGQDDVNRERTETPTVFPEFLSWDENPATPRVPEYPHRKKAVVDFIRSLPAEEGPRRAALRYLDRLLDFKSAEAAKLGLQYVLRLPDMDAEREKQLGRLIDDPGLAKGPRAEPDANPVPTFFATLPRDGTGGREAVAAEIRALWAVLPPGGLVGESPRGYVLNHFIEMDLDNLKAFAEFVENLPADPAERLRRIDYLERWNADERRVNRRGNPIFSLWFHVSNPNAMMAIHLGVLAVLLLFTAGAYTRVTSVLAWLAALGYIHRAQQVLFGMDTMMSILMFYLMIGNSGAALSVDRRLRRKRAEEASRRRFGAVDDRTRALLAEPTPSVSAGFALRCIQVHFCFIYLASGLSKLKGPAWWNGTAIWDVMVNPEFTLLRYPWYEWAVRQGIELKPMYYSFIAGGAWFTLFLEVGFAFLIWTRLRPYIVFLAIVLHAQIAVLMGLNLFELMMMILLLAYIPGGVVRDWLAKSWHVGGETAPAASRQSAATADAVGSAAAR